jgi:hypothetical protein
VALLVVRRRGAAWRGGAVIRRFMVSLIKRMLARPDLSPAERDTLTATLCHWEHGKAAVGVALLLGVVFAMGLFAALLLAATASDTAGALP